MNYYESSMKHLVVNHQASDIDQPRDMYALMLSL